MNRKKRLSFSFLLSQAILAAITVSSVSHARVIGGSNKLPSIEINFGVLDTLKEEVVNKQVVDSDVAKEESKQNVVVDDNVDKNNFIDDKSEHKVITKTKDLVVNDNKLLLPSNRKLSKVKLPVLKESVMTTNLSKKPVEDAVDKIELILPNPDVTIPTRRVPKENDQQDVALELPVIVGPEPLIAQDDNINQSPKSDIIDSSDDLDKTDPNIANKLPTPQEEQILDNVTINNKEIDNVKTDLIQEAIIEKEKVKEDKEDKEDKNNLFSFVSKVPVIGLLFKSDEENQAKKIIVSDSNTIKDKMENVHLNEVTEQKLDDVTTLANNKRDITETGKANEDVLIITPKEIDNQQVSYAPIPHYKPSENVKAVITKSVSDDNADINNNDSLAVVTINDIENQVNTTGTDVQQPESIDVVPVIHTKRVDDKQWSKILDDAKEKSLLLAENDTNEELVDIEVAEVVKLDDKKVDILGAAASDTNEFKKENSFSEYWNNLTSSFSSEDKSNVESKSELEDTVIVKNDTDKIAKIEVDKEIVTKKGEVIEDTAQIEENLPAKLPDVINNNENIIRPIELVNADETEEELSEFNKNADKKLLTDSLKPSVPLVTVNDDINFVEKNEVASIAEKPVKKDEKQPIDLDNLFEEDKDKTVIKNVDTESVSKGPARQDKAVKELFSAPYEASGQVVKEVVNSVDNSPKPEFSINYITNEVELTQFEKDRLSEFIQHLLDSDQKIKIVSYGPKNENEINISRRISLKRAIAIRAAMMASGLDSSRINVQAIGKADNSDDSNKVNVFIAS